MKYGTSDINSVLENTNEFAEPVTIFYKDNTNKKTTGVVSQENEEIQDEDGTILFTNAIRITMKKNDISFNKEIDNIEYNDRFYKIKHKIEDDVSIYLIVTSLK